MNKHERIKFKKFDEEQLLKVKLIDQIKRSIEGFDVRGNPYDLRLNNNKQDTLWKFYNSLNAGDGTKVNSLKSMVAYINVVKNFGLYLEEHKKDVVDFKDVKKQDIVDYFSFISTNGYRNGTKLLAKSTISYYRFVIKIFYRWLFQTGNDWPDVVKWIPNKISGKRIIEPDKLLSNSEIKEMVKKSGHVRDKAVIIVCYEGALRVGELTGIKIRDVVFRDGFCEITVDGKTGKRVLPLIDSQPYIQDWINHHPFKDYKDSPLFINISSNKFGRQITRSAVRGILDKSSERAGIHKRIFPHLLRHSRLTHMAEQGYNERDLRMYAGWSNDSEMPNTYIHYGYEGLKNKILTKKQRLSNKERTRQIMEQNANIPKKCPRCGKENPSDALYCHCGMALDLRTVQRELRRREEGDDVLNKIINNPELNKVFMELIKKASGL